MEVIPYGKEDKTVVVFGDLPRMGTKHTVSIIQWFKKTFACDVCIVSGKNERYLDDFDLPVNYIDWEIENYDLLVEQQLVHIWKHYQTCEMLPKKYTNIIRARSDIQVMHIEQRYMSQVVYNGFAADYTLGFGHLGADKMLTNFRKKADGFAIPFLADYVISHRRDHIQNPEGIVSMNWNAHESWTHVFKKRMQMENVHFPIIRIEDVDNKEFMRVK